MSNAKELELKQKVRDSGLLIDRLNSVKEKISKMCRERRPPKVSIPIQWSDEDWFIITTIDDAMEALKRKPADGTGLITRERFRQIMEENHPPALDKAWDNCELAFVAAAYVLNAALNVENISTLGFDVMNFFPWAKRHFKPRTTFGGGVQKERYLKDLVRAGALVAAEIDRVLAIQEDENGAQ